MFMLILTFGVALMTAYLFWRFVAAFRKHRWWLVAGAGVLVLLAGARYWGLALERAGLDGAADAGRSVLVVWLALVFWFLCAGIVLQVTDSAAWAASKACPRAKKLRIHPRAQFLVAGAAVLLAAGWGFFEARSVGVEHVVVEVDRVPGGRESLRIAQISDIHVGSLYSRQRLAAAIRRLRQLQPDLIVSTGDLVDGQFHDTSHLAEELAAVRAPLGQYAIIGNHEVYTGLGDTREFTDAAGFRLLRQQVVEPIDGLLLVGVDDPAVRWRGGDDIDISELPLLPPGPTDDVVILLKHQPVVDPAALGRFDVQLSGHTHGGQIFPFELFTRLRYDYGPGRHDLPDGSTLYVSRGTGTWGPPFRLGAWPEVTLIELRQK